MADKKLKSVDDIISGYQKYHHKTGKEFKDRIKKFEEFNDSENIHGQQFAHHAHYTIFGNPSDEKSYPGAYNTAHKAINKLKDKEGNKLQDGDKVKDVDELTKILESYTDTFLEKAMGKNFKKTIEHAKKESKLDEKDLRKLKGQLMGQYHTDDKGNPINILDDNYIKKLKGKKKIELIDQLRNMSEEIKNSYTSHLVQKTLNGLISEDDRLDMAKYITPLFEKKGMKHKDDHILRSAIQQANHYSSLLNGQHDQLVKQGYKPFKPKEDKKKK